MKPTIWYYGGHWVCACTDYSMPPPSDTEDYILWSCAGYGNTPQEAYDDYVVECDLYRKELEGE